MVLIDIGCQSRNCGDTGNESGDELPGNLGDRLGIARRGWRRTAHATNQLQINDAAHVEMDLICLCQKRGGACVWQDQAGYQEFGIVGCLALWLLAGWRVCWY
jgi:hypothetical protein